MTSSLVGSEMCIRDSADIATQHKEDGTGGGEEEEAGSDSGGESSSSEPVSYTHLTLPTICSV
eukprot:2307122-Prorocentrum_lima.AAC.1